MSSITLVPSDTYIAMLHNAEGSNLFRTVYALIDGKREDITDDGNKSCALFVSSLLYHFRLIQEVHTGMFGLEKDIRASGWTPTDKLIKGAVLFWEPIEQASGVHAHCGFYVGNEEAISNRDTVRTPATHHVTFGTNPDGSPVRKITVIFSHTFLQAK